MYIKVKVSPNVKKEKVFKLKEDTFHVSVRVKAERNMANKRMVEMMAEYLNISINKIRIISGHHSGSKIISVDL